MTRYLLPLTFYYRQGKKKIMTPPAVELLQPTAYLGHAPFCWRWNAPMKSVNHYRMEELPPAPLTPLQRLIAEDAQRRRRQKPALTEEQQIRQQTLQDVIEKAEERHLVQEKARWQARQNQRRRVSEPAWAVEEVLKQQPKFIRQPLQKRLDYLRREAGDKRAEAFLLKGIKPALQRLAALRDKQQTPDYQQVAGWARLEGLLWLPALSRKEVKRLATLVAGHIETVFCSFADRLPADNTDPNEILRIYQQVANKAKCFAITPPYWHSLNQTIQHRGKVPYHLIPGALARLCCAEWWTRQLWRLRCEWREEQHRASCLVHKQASAYVSQDALTRKREQDRCALDFIRSHELVNEAGVTLDMEQVVKRSTSNPHLRRLEMMTTAKGLENLAEQRGDYAMFYTITCPSRYHATLSCGKPNPKWALQTVRESSDYLVNLFAGVRKKMNKLGLRWYGRPVA